MHVIVLKYVQVLCITIFFSNNINCDKLLLHNEQEDQELYRIGACTAACMAGTEPGGPVDRNATGTTVPSAEELKTIGYCYKRCSEDTRPLSAWRPLVQRQDPSLRINLICRDSTNLIIEIKPTALEAGGGVGGNHHHQDSKLTPKLSAPGGNQNQLNALRDRSASAESLESAAPARSRRAIGADGPLSAGQLTERQKASSGTRTNLLQPTAGKIDGPTLHGSVDAAAHEDDDTDNVAVKVQPDREHYQRALAAEQDRTRPPVPIYLVKVQDSEQELGDRIVYMCPYTKLQRIAAAKRHTTVKIDAARRLGLRLLDRDVGQYSFDNDTVLCQINSAQLGEFGVYDLSLRPDGNGCTLETAKEPVNIYLPFLTIALLACAAFGLVRLARYGLRRSRAAGFQQPAASDTAAGDDTAHSSNEENDRKPTQSGPGSGQDTPKKRLQSLDTFRGIAIMLMIFVNSGGGHYWWIEHATWNGLHVADLVFPWFLFIMGVCVPISLRGQLNRNVPKRTILSSIAVRSVKLFIIGLCLNSMNGPSMANLRIFGVLQRFGIAYLVVSTVHLLCHEQQVQVQSQNRLLRASEDIVRLKKQWLVIGLLTVLYLVVMFFVGAPGCPSAYFGPGGKHLYNAFPNCTGGITGYIDRALLGIAHLYQHPTARYVYDGMPFDPEGPFGCLPTILQVFLGLQCGCTILAYTEHHQRMVRFACWSLVLGLAAGALCGFTKNDGWIPINKNLWSLSYVLATASLAHALLLLCYYAIDVKRAWHGRPFVYAGMNAIVLYVGHTVFHKMLPWHWRIGTMNTHFVLTLEALWNTVLWNLIALYLYKRKIFYNLSNASLVKIENLAPNRRYNVTATMLTSEYEYYYVEKHQYRTLPHDYMPGIVTDIMVERFETNARDSRLVDAVISWTPAKDRTCHYEIVCHASYSPDFLLKPIDVQQPEVLYKYTIKALKLSANYMIAVRSKNTQNAMRESQLHWQSFHTPSCTNHTNGTQVCAPEPITNVRVTQVPLYGDHYQLNISWDRPTIAPDSYVVKVFDLHNPETEEPGNSVTKNLTGDAVGVLIESFEMFGPHFEVLVAAYSRVGVSSENTIKALQIGRVSSESWIRTKLVFIILTPVLMIGLLKISISLICRRRAKLKRYEERCEYFKELEQKAPVDPSTEFEPTSKQMQDLLATSHPFSPDLIAPINDELEIEMEHIKLHDMLGEGAFGLVRKGVLQRTGDDGEPAQPVAVKMLKECPRVEDILEFRREMEVMKSVGTHPHIVGIVGHCTKNVRKMMLLTEYCGRGNLLNYLRLQWQRLLRQNRTTGTRSIGGTSGTNITATLPSPPPPPPPPPTRSMEMAEHECLTPSLDNNKMPENVFNFDTSFVNDKKSLTYKNISDHRQTLLGVAFGLAGGSDGSSASRSPQIIENKLYPLFSDESDGDETAQLTHCTNACKNAVEIVEGTWEVGEDVKGSVRIKPCSCHGAPVDSTLTNNTVENRWYQSCSPQSEEEEDPLPNSGQLLEFSRQIALGMEFLARNKVVHRDLAARNVLVCDSNTVKIADFGLSRDIYQENLYRKTSNGKLPIKWLALESMTHQVYTSQSDVWSYGILLYEICTLGGSPYPAISTNRLLRYLESGYRMERPKSCSELLYDLMYSCWNLHPGERPTFSKIVHTVEQLQARDTANDPVVIDLSAIVDSHCTKNTTEENSYLKPVEY